MHDQTLVQEHPRKANPTGSSVQTKLEVLWQQDKVRFLVVGAFNTAFGYCVFAALYLLVGSRIHYLVIGTLSHVLSVMVSFSSQRYLAFRSRTPWLRAFLRFNISLLAVFLSGLLALYGLVHWLGISPLLGQTIVTVLSVVGSYFAHRHFSFRKS